MGGLWDVARDNKMSPGRTQGDPFGAPFGYPRVLGAYLAVNAIPDTWMLVDSADCATLRAEIIQDNHDWLATLITEEGHYRIASTGVCPHTIVLDRRDMLAEQFAVVAKERGAFMFIYPAPVTALVGVDYRNVLATIEIPEETTALVVDPVDSVGNWVAGYSHMMELVATHLLLPDMGRKRKSTVALVGYLWDRNEADHEASVEELKKLLTQMGLETTSVWLSGCSTEDLQRVAEAETLLALPYGRAAAQILGERTGARVVDVDLPVGFEATVSWVEFLAAELGLSTAALAAMEAAAADAYRRAAKAVMRHLVDRPFAICTESLLGARIAAMVLEMGGDVQLLATAGERLSPADTKLADVVLENSTMEQVSAALRYVADDALGWPVLIGSERALAAVEPGRFAVVPMGFQAGGTHHLYSAPFVGFAGALSLLDRIGNAIALRDLGV
jgi:nitrogenase molybdenum-iron protein alpha/beta subunit